MPQFISRSFSHSRILVLFSIATVFILQGCQSDKIGASIISSSENFSDLIILEARLSPSSEKAGNVDAFIVLENKGNLPISKGFTIFGGWLDNPSLVTRSIIQVSGPIGAFTKHTVQTSLPLSSLLGKKGRYMFAVDICPNNFCNDQIPESNEENNTIEFLFAL